MAKAERTEIFDISLAKFFQAVSDFSSYPEFVTGVKNVSVEGARVNLDMDLMKRIEYSILVNQQLDATRGEASLNWKLDKSQQMKTNNGSWKLKSLSPSKTEVTYSLELEFSFPVPGFILKGLVANSLPKAMKEFADRALKL